jgi:hypothetical protein
MFNGKTVKELKENNIVNFGEIKPIEITIPDSRTFYDGINENSVTMYQIFIKSASGDLSMTERRYSDFSMLDKIIKSRPDNQSLGTLPKLPVKVINPWTDQKAVEFVSSRRDALETYLSELLLNPLVIIFQFFMQFNNSSFVLMFL